MWITLTLYAELLSSPPCLEYEAWFKLDGLQLRYIEVDYESYVEILHDDALTEENLRIYNEEVDYI
jgi:hypothetical protein